MNPSPVAVLADRALELYLDAHPVAASRFGFPDRDHLLPDPSVGAEAERARELRQLRAEVSATPAAGERDWVTREVLLHSLDLDARELESGLADLDVGTQFAGAQTVVLHELPRLDLSDPARAASYLDRLAAVPGFLAAASARLRDGAARGRTPAAAPVLAAVAELDRYLTGSEQSDPLLRPEGDTDWVTRARDLIDTCVRPALAAYRDVLTEDLLPVARPDERAGLHWLDEGPALYRLHVTVGTTSELTAEDLHRLGREELARVEAELPEVARQVPGAPTGSAADVFVWLRDAAPRFASRDAALAHARLAIDRAWAAAPACFHHLPATPCEVREVPAFEAATSPRAWYQEPDPGGGRGGTYWINTSRPEYLARHDAEAVAFHEGVPGHHLQIALMMASSDLPMIRRVRVSVAHAEGWGLYAERLADTLGLYSGPLDRLGLLTTEAMRAARLVVDTGLHHRGWTIARCEAFLSAHTAWPLPDVHLEVRRYVTWPGQALGYLTGRHELDRLQERARRSLGEAFTLPDFHHQVLGHGSLPLTVLASVLDRWTAAPPDHRTGVRSEAHQP